MKCMYPHSFAPVLLAATAQEVKGSGLANQCPILGPSADDGLANMPPGSYRMDMFCMEPNSFQVHCRLAVVPQPVGGKGHQGHQGRRAAVGKPVGSSMPACQPPVPVCRSSRWVAPGSNLPPCSPATPTL